MSEMTHHQVEELAGAFALGALDPDEDAALRAHMADCRESHPEMEAALGLPRPRGAAGSTGSRRESPVRWPSPRWLP